MSRVRVVTDSTADIPAEVREALGIEMVPLKVHIGMETYLDSVTIQPEEFYRKLENTKILPTTSQPSPVDFLNTYKRLAAADPGAPILSIHLSSALSGTYQSAMMAKSLLEETAEADISIVDSQSACYGFGIMVVRAAEAAREGKSKEEILEMLQDLHAHLSLYFLVDSLEYLHKGGRLGKAAAYFGTLLNIKPILSIDRDGEIFSVDKVRGQKKAMAKIVEMLKEKWGPNDGMEAAISHSNSQEAAEELSALISGNFAVKKTYYTNIGPVIGSHTGPGTVAVFILPV